MRRRGCQTGARRPRTGAMADASTNDDEEAALGRILAQARACTMCAAHLPLGPRPVLRGRASARLLVMSQAPGTRVHQTGLSFDDRSGDRLRHWMGIGRDTFYDERRIAIVPMGLCYPGRYPKGGDLPPRRECAALGMGRCWPGCRGSS